MLENENLPMEDEKAQEETAETLATVKKENLFSASLKKRLSAKRLAFMGVFVALSYAVSWLQTPALFGTPFLKLDLGNVFIVLVSFLLGPIEGVVVCLLKESLRLIGSDTYAGELANFLVTSSYLLLPSVLYQFRKKLKTVIISLIVACFIATGVALIANRFLVFPAYSLLTPDGTLFGMTVAQAFKKYFWALVAFNLLKSVLVGVITIILYKRLSNFLKKMKI